MRNAVTPAKAGIQKAVTTKDCLMSILITPIPTFPLDGEGAYAIAPLDGEGAYATAPLDGERGYATAPLNGERGYATIPLDGERGYATVPLDGVGGYATIRWRTGQSRLVPSP